MNWCVVHFTNFLKFLLFAIVFFYFFIFFTFCNTLSVFFLYCSSCFYLFTSVGVCSEYLLLTRVYISIYRVYLYVRLKRTRIHYAPQTGLASLWESSVTTKGCHPTCMPIMQTVRVSIAYSYIDVDESKCNKSKSILSMYYI